jgi:hypothetical protein
MKKPNNFAVDYQKLPRKLRHSGRDHFNLGIEVRSFDKFTLATAGSVPRRLSSLFPAICRTF